MSRSCLLCDMKTSDKLESNFIRHHVFELMALQPYITHEQRNPDSRLDGSNPLLLSSYQHLKKFFEVQQLGVRMVCFLIGTPYPHTTTISPCIQKASLTKDCPRGTLLKSSFLMIIVGCKASFAIFSDVTAPFAIMLELACYSIRWA
jgi:hypothetical protein